MDDDDDTTVDKGGESDGDRWSDFPRVVLLLEAGYIYQGSEVEGLCLWQTLGLARRKVSSHVE